MVAPIFGTGTQMHQSNSVLSRPLSFLLACGELQLIPTYMMPVQRYQKHFHILHRPRYLSNMSFFNPPPKPNNPLAYHRILSPTASVKVSPLCLGGISIGSSWSEIFGKNENADSLLDAFYALGGNFIDTSSSYNGEDSERLIGEWMEKRGNRDQMVVATKYSAGYKAYQRKEIPLQSNYTGNSAKSMHVSVRDSLAKLKTDYIDILYVHW
jgi:hypothetical protein